MKKTEEPLPGEKVLWTGRPEKGPFWMVQLKNVVVGIFQIAVLTAIVLYIDRTGWPGAITTTLKIVSVVGFLLAGVGLISPLIAVRALKISKYKVTNQRVIVVEGLREGKVRDLSLKEVDQIRLVKGWQNQPFGTGTVHITAVPGNETTWPYGIFLGIKDAETVVQTLRAAVAEAQAKMKKRR